MALDGGKSVSYLPHPLIRRIRLGVQDAALSRRQLLAKMHARTAHQDSHHQKAVLCILLGDTRVEVVPSILARLLHTDGYARLKAIAEK